MCLHLSLTFLYPFAFGLPATGPPTRDLFVCWIARRSLYSLCDVCCHGWQVGRLVGCCFKNDSNASNSVKTHWTCSKTQGLWSVSKRVKQCKKVVCEKMTPCQTMSTRCIKKCQNVSACIKKVSKSVKTYLSNVKTQAIWQFCVLKRIRNSARVKTSNFLGSK